MEPSFYLFIFGTLALAVGAVAGGFWLHSGFGVFLIVAGIVGFVAWLVMFFRIMAALNSDI